MCYIYDYLRSETSRNIVKGEYSNLGALSRLRWMALKVASLCPMIRDSCSATIDNIASMEFGELVLCCG